MLTTDSWRAGSTSSSRVEVPVYFGREMSPNIMERYTNRDRGPRLPQPYAGYYMEQCKRSGVKRPLTQAEERRIQEGQSRETVAEQRFWRLRPDGIAVLPPVGNKTGVFCILEHKRMSDVCDQYVVRAKREAEDQYSSLRSALSGAIQVHTTGGLEGRTG